MALFFAYSWQNAVSQAIKLVMELENLYLDYNATAPLSASVLDYLKNRSLYPYANASAGHSLGKQAQNDIADSKDKIFNRFDLDSKSFRLYFHSGATEGLNTFFNLKENEVMAYCETDHPAIHNIAANLELRGVQTKKIKVTALGSIDLNHLDQQLKDLNSSIYFNFTHVHNETGWIWDLSLAEKIKDQYKCNVHVDCAQSVGKFNAWNQLSSKLDMYTFSGHKFGALKGIGFSFVNTEFKLRPLLIGGGQQEGLRGGTLNLSGIHSVALALSDVKDCFSLAQELKDRIKDLFKKYLKEKVIFIDEQLKLETNPFTICLIIKESPADLNQIKFDLNNISLSFGSACSSGSNNGSSTMAALGFSDQAKNMLRLSFGSEQIQQSERIMHQLETAIKSL